MCTHLYTRRAVLGQLQQQHNPFFTGARLERVNFEFSNLSRVKFGDARISDVNFKGAYTFRTRFEDVDLRGALNLHQLHLKLACGNENTKLPEGLSMPENWPCTE